MTESKDYYPESSPTDDESNLPPKDEEDDKAEGETALLPKSLFGDVAVGETVSLKVVHIYEDEIEVEKVGEKEPGTMKGPPTSDQEIDVMAMAKE